MGESAEHLDLVQALRDYIESRLCGCYSLAVLGDLPGSSRQERPPRIAGYIPDVYATDAPTTQVIIGEAKTEDDLETEHSRRQLRAFIEFLVCRERGTLVLAVPWQAASAARNLAERLAGSGRRPELVVLDRLRR